MKSNRKNPTPSPKLLNELSRVDLHSLDKCSLVDIADVFIDTSLPLADRIADYLSQIQNPYCYLCNDIAVKISFAGECTLEDAIHSALQMSAPVAETVSTAGTPVIPAPVENAPTPTHNTSTEAA